MGDFWQNWKDALRRGHRFATHEIWQIGTPGEEVPQGFITKQIRVAILLGSKVVDGMHMVRASALTFATLLSIVPFLALTFYFVQTNLAQELYVMVQGRLETAAETVSGTFSGDVTPPQPDDVAAPDETEPEDTADAVVQEPVSQEAAPASTAPEPEQPEPEAPPPAGQSTAEESAATAGEQTATEEPQLRERIIDALFQGVTREREGMKDPAETISQAADTIAQLADEAAESQAALTVSGIILVLTTVFGLMRNIENTFNRIWGVRRTRSWYRMITDYLVITLLIPFIVTAVLGVMAALQSEAVTEVLGPFAFVLRFSQFALVVVVFTLLYRFVPNTHVYFRYALIAGLVAGALWVLLSAAYVNFQFGLARYGVIFSAFAQFPMLLMWIYLSWAIVLLGCEVSYAYQNENTFALERFADDASYAYREAVGLRAMVEVGYRFEQGLPELTVEQAAREWNVPMRLLSGVLESLSDAGLLAPRATEPVQYQPARPLRRIHAGDIIRVLREDGTEPSRFRQDERFRRMFGELERLDQAFGGASLEELVQSYQASLEKARDEASETVNA